MPVILELGNDLTFKRGEVERHVRRFHVDRIGFFILEQCPEHVLLGEGVYCGCGIDQIDPDLVVGVGVPEELDVRGCVDAASAPVEDNDVENRWRVDSEVLIQDVSTGASGVRDGRKLPLWRIG